MNCPKRAVCCHQAPSFLGREGRVCVASVLALQVFTAQASFDVLLRRTCTFPEAHDSPFSGGRLLWSIRVLLEARPAASPLSRSMVPAPVRPGPPFPLVPTLLGSLPLGPPTRRLWSPARLAVGIGEEDGAPTPCGKDHTVPPGVRGGQHSYADLREVTRAWEGVSVIWVISPDKGQETLKRVFKMKYKSVVAGVG